MKVTNAFPHIDIIIKSIDKIFREQKIKKDISIIQKNMAYATVHYMKINDKFVITFSSNFSPFLMKIPSSFYVLVIPLS